MSSLACWDVIITTGFYIAGAVSLVGLGILVGQLEYFDG